MTKLDLDAIVRRWCNSVYACDGTRLWSDHRCVKRPDVVYELASGDIVCLEVEPQDGAALGIVQLAKYAICFAAKRFCVAARALSGQS